MAPFLLRLDGYPSFAIRALVKLMIKASTDPKARREMNYIIRIVERFAILTVFLRMFGGRGRR